MVSFCKKSKQNTFTLLSLSIVFVFCGTLNPVWAYKLLPISDIEAVDQLPIQSFLENTFDQIIDDFSDPVHESIIAQVYGCDDKQLGVCINEINRIPTYVLEGLRWNDNPTFRQTSNTLVCRRLFSPKLINIDTSFVCWLTLFYDAQKKAKQGEHFQSQFAFIYRVHFGDLQFFHSMASWNDEPAIDTQQHILNWLEFTYKVANGEYSNLDAEIASEFPKLSPQFLNNGFNVRTLFSPQTILSDASLRAMAKGSLFHTIEDSFSQSHVNRDEHQAGQACDGLTLPKPGLINAFYAYNTQNSSMHSVADSMESAQTQLGSNNDPFVIVQAIETQLFQKNISWDNAKAYFECIYALDPKAPVAGPGVFFKKTVNSN